MTYILDYIRFEKDMTAVLQLTCSTGCSMEQYQCFSGRCIPLSMFYISGCSIEEYQCFSGRCIPLSMFFITGCSMEEYQCFSGRCIPLSMFCDGVRDCMDDKVRYWGSDEDTCGNEKYHYFLLREKRKRSD